MNARLRIWCLFVLAASDYAGISPLSRRRFHRVFFLANTLAPHYRQPYFVDLVYRWENGPFYPDAQWQLYRLIGSGLATLNSYSGAKAAATEWDREQVSMHSRALPILQSCRQIGDWKSVECLLRDCAFALGEIEENRRTDIVLENDVYQSKIGADEGVINFSSANSTVKTIESVCSSLGDHSRHATSYDLVRTYTELMLVRSERNYARP